ncbi:MAG: DUF192 domain-containing protein [Burkholderiales bacterium]|jgi:uncharacterized membrane protein (UPF0127 family)|nr:DUF192 domain-containing protein [Burkholderiales bacterium]
MRSLLATFLLSVLAATGLAQTSPQPPLPAVKLTAGMHLITAELADDDRERMVGLMFREKLAPNHGMLFDFKGKFIHCMWMRNTLIPLSVAYLEDDGTIVNIEDMAPKTEGSHCAKKPVRFALEMDRGWFAQRGIKPGMKLGGLPTK